MDTDLFNTEREPNSEQSSPCPEYSTPLTERGPLTVCGGAPAKNKHGTAASPPHQSGNEGMNMMEFAKFFIKQPSACSTPLKAPETPKQTKKRKATPGPGKATRDKLKMAIEKSDDSILSAERPEKLQHTDLALTENIPGEDVRELLLDSPTSTRAKRFAQEGAEFVDRGLDKWAEKGLEIAKECEFLIHRTITARMAMAERYRKLTDAVIKYAKDLENHDSSIEAKREQLKETGHKILDELDFTKK